MGLTGADLARLGPAAQKQVLEKLGQQTQTGERKYHNEPVMVNGIHFDSKKEANRFTIMYGRQERRAATASNAGRSISRTGRSRGTGKWTA